MKTIRCGTIDLHTVDVGQGPPILLVHGFPLDHTMWRPQIDELSRDHRVIAPDLRGFGQSRLPDGPNADEAVTMEQFADDLALLLDGLGVTEPVTLCGLSMGGYIAFQFWRRHAKRLARLILCDTRAIADSPDAAQGRLATAKKVLAEGASVVAEAMLPKLLAASTAEKQPQIKTALRQTMLATPPAGIAAALRGMAVRPDVTSWLPSVQVPTLVLVGSDDAIAPPAEMRSIAAAIPGAQFVEIAAAGHMAPWENAAASNAALRKFLA
ncbi:MAG: alpha/beta fold hydrolase [Pirellulales bacterium]